MLKHILYYHFPQKNLAEESYSTFNLRLSIVWAAALLIKTNQSRVSYMAPIRRQEARASQMSEIKSFDNFFQQDILERW